MSSEKSPVTDPKLPLGTNYCRCSACGLHFGGESSFAAHRTGPMDARRCLTPAEMCEAGLAPSARGYWGRPLAGTQRRQLDRLARPRR